ncbi:Or13a [Drosophila busckii]|uniref:Odorant receptor n=1 Tax=Drosophila busckii TaxID=30019 RepID=A0A0M4FA07_DROBS|nr:Or13a [Drosophila busckii]
MFKPKTSRDPEFRIPLQCIWLKLNGSWPLAVGSTEAEYLYGMAYTLWSLYVIISVGITICFQTAFLLNQFGDIIMITESCCTTLMGALNFVRLVHLRLNQRKFRQILQQFVTDIWIAEHEHEQISQQCRRKMITFRIMTVLLSCLILMYCILPLVELIFILDANAELKPFPYKMAFPFNPYKQLSHYALTYAFTAYAGICVVTTLFAEDSILGFFITYTCGQFRLLHERIDQLMSQLPAVGVDRVEFQKQQLHQLNSIAHKHNRIMCFAQQLENFFNPILLVNVMISALLICMVGFQLVTSKNMFIGDYAKFLVYIFSSTTQLYILCGNGDTLIQHTAVHLYACGWEQLERGSTNKEFRTNLRFMILCSQRPVKITAFKFSTLSLQSFTAILSTSMSYFTLLRSVYDDNQE